MFTSGLCKADRVVVELGSRGILLGGQILGCDIIALFVSCFCASVKWVIAKEMRMDWVFLISHFASSKY